jgi:hypothetical protein
MRFTFVALVSVHVQPFREQFVLSPMTAKTSDERENTDTGRHARSRAHTQTHPQTDTHTLTH